MASRILVADDDAQLRAALGLALGMEGYEFIFAEDGESALRQFQAERPDLVVLDIGMPKLDGFTVVERIRSSSAVPVLILTARDSLNDRVQGLKHGADDYLVKPFAIEELLARIEALLRRLHPDDNHLLTFGDLKLDLETHEAARDGVHLQLTPREFQLLAAFLHYPRQVLTRDQLSRQAWGYAYHSESNFVDVAVKALRAKLEAEGEPRVIQTVRGFGYALRED